MTIDSGVIGRINKEILSRNSDKDDHYRGRPPIKKDVIYIVRKELEAIARYGQFRLRGINYNIEMNETEDEISLRITVPLKQFPLVDISKSLEGSGEDE